MRRSFIIGFTLIFLVVLGLDLYPGLRGGAGWRWPYALPESWLPVLILAVLVSVYLIGALWVRSRVIWMGLTWAVLGGTVLAYAVTGIAAEGDAVFHLVSRTLSPVQTGASALAVRVMEAEGLQNTLENWPDVMRAAKETNLIHFTTSPPGQPLLHYWVADLFDAESLVWFSQPVSQSLRSLQCSDVEIMRYTRGELVSAGFVGLLMPFFAALTALPLFSAARNLSGGDSKTALRLALWWPLIPAVLLFAPTWNTLYPLLCTWAFALLLRGLMRNSPLYALLAGLVMSVTTFLNFSVLPTFAIFGLFTLGYWYFIARKTSARPFIWTVVMGAWFGAGLLVVWIIFGLATGLTPLDLLRVGLGQHSELVVREMLPWLILHPYDVLMFTGWPLALLALWGMILAALRLRPRGEQPDAIDVLALSMGITFIVVNLAGLVQGENARILIFYMPFLLLSAGTVNVQSKIAGPDSALIPPPPSPTGEGGAARETTNSQKSPSPGEESGDPLVARVRAKLVWDAPLLVVQGLTVLVMAAVLPVVPLDLNPQPGGPRTDIATLGDDIPTNPDGSEFSSEDYAGAFTLTGYTFVGDPASQAITFDLAWEGQTPTERPYQFEMRAFAENSIDGEIISQAFHWYPQNSNYPTTCWRETDSLRDVIVLPLPPVSEPVVWTVELRAVDTRSGDVMRVTDAEGRVSDVAIFGPIPYP